MRFDLKCSFSPRSFAFVELNLDEGDCSYSPLFNSYFTAFESVLTFGLVYFWTRLNLVLHTGSVGL